MAKTRKPGRPAVFTGKVKKHIVSLVRRYGLTGARKRLAAENSTELSNDRNKKVVPNPLKISMPTLAKFAAEDEVEVPQGRPSAKLRKKRKEVA